MNAMLSGVLGHLAFAQVKKKQSKRLTINYILHLLHRSSIIEAWLGL